MPSYYTYDSANMKNRNTFTSTVQQGNTIKRYFSSLDSDVYFGSILIDELTAINFSVTENKMPIFGFNSFIANRMIAGQRVIQGAFAINFTKTNYLLNILNNIDDSILHSGYDSIITRCEGNNPLFEKEFDITIVYGYLDSYEASMQTLLGCRITNYQQALDTDGNPILDMYTFIAKDLKIDGIEMNVDTESNDITSNDEYETYSIISANDSDKRTELYNQCNEDENFIGIIVDPIFHGNAKDNSYYTTLTLEIINCKESNLSKIRIYNIDSKVKLDNGMGLNINYELTKSSNGIYKYTFESGSRDHAIALYRKFEQEPSYNHICIVECTIFVNGKNEVFTQEVSMGFLND